MARHKDTKIEKIGQSVPQHGTQIKSGKCRDCAQGMIGKVIDGFEYFDLDEDGRGYWFCCYCGSNHVTVIFNNSEIEQGDLY